MSEETAKLETPEVSPETGELTEQDLEQAAGGAGATLAAAQKVHDGSIKQSPPPNGIIAILIG